MDFPITVTFRNLAHSDALEAEIREEAAALGDRCVVFTARPGRIRSILASPLPRERDLMRLRHDRQYVQLAAELWDMITPTLAATRGETA